MDDTYIEMINTRIIVLLNGNYQLIPVEQFKLRENEGYPYLTLKDISDQLRSKYPDQLIVIDVWQELGLRGYIYQYGNHGEFWEEHGTTKGYA